jgi:nucleoside-diphosphate-sugar epimerase
VPAAGDASPHLASRLAVEETLLDGVPGSVALRASIVIGARSRSFRFLVHLVERLPVLALPGWRENRTAPIDGRDVLAYLEAAATAEAAAGRSLDIAGPDTVTYGELVGRIRDFMLVGRPEIRFGFTATPIASRVAAVVAGEDHGLIGPLMGGLETDLLPRDDDAAALLGVRPHRLDAAIERALRDWETAEELRAR